MLQVKMTEAFKMSFLDTPVPEIGDDEVLIQMKRVGVCGSDIQIYHGKHKYMTFPVVQGHEGAGVVTKVGGKVSGFKEGDKVELTYFRAPGLAQVVDGSADVSTVQEGDYATTSAELKIISKSL